MEQKTAALLLFLFLLFPNVKRPTPLHPGSFATPFLARVSAFGATEAEVKRERETPTDNPYLQFTSTSLYLPPTPNRRDPDHTPCLLTCSAVDL